MRCWPSPPTTTPPPALTAGKVDAWVVDNEVAAGAWPPEQGLTVLDEAMTSEPVCLRIRRRAAMNWSAPFNDCAGRRCWLTAAVEQIFQQYGVTVRRARKPDKTAPIYGTRGEQLVRPR